MKFIKFLGKESPKSKLKRISEAMEECFNKGDGWYEVCSKDIFEEIREIIEG